MRHRQTFRAPPAERIRKARGLADQLGLSQVLAQVLVQRGMETSDEIGRFLAPKLSDLTPPEDLTDFDAAVDRVLDAVRGGEHVGVFGDYDVDGITSVAVVASYLEALGLVVTPRLARRDSGYGIQPEDVRELKEAGCSLLVACDVGTCDFDALEEARVVGLDVVVLDHHKVAERLPETVALVNPSRPDSAFPEETLASVGLSFYLVSGLRTKLKAARLVANPPDPRELLDLVAVGTVADVVPLRRANRIMVHRGLRLLGAGRRPGLRALVRRSRVVADVGVRARDISFGLAPRLNAAGRLGDARPAFELLMAKDASQAEALADRLEEMNGRRRAYQDMVFDAATQQVHWGQAGEHILVVDGAGWHPGVVGIVASKLVERFHRPAIVISLDEETGIGRGSGRSDGLVDLHAMLKRGEDMLLSFGGHAAAAGLVVKRDRIGDLRRFLNEAVAALGTKSLGPVEVDAALEVGSIDASLMESLGGLEPVGAGNPSPLFAAMDVPIQSVRKMGGEHIRLQVGPRSRSITAVGFSMAEDAPAAGRTVDLVFRLEWDSYFGPGAVRLNLVQIGME